MESLLQDVRYGLRMLLKAPGFTIVAVLTLTLGIGANTAIFSVVNSVLLRPLPYDEADKLMLLSERSPQLEGMSISYPNFLDWRQQQSSFEHIAVFRRQSYNLTGTGEPERLVAGQVSAEMFPALRVQPARGRTFTAEEDKPGAELVTVLSHGLWQRRFGSDENILGQTLNLNGKQYTVIGVMPPDFIFPSRVELWTPVGQEYSNPGWQHRGNHPGLYGVARLNPGVTLEQARADMNTIAEGLERQYPDTNVGGRVTITPLHENVVRDIRPSLLFLLGAVGLVLLIACVNVANLLLARAATRQKEIAIRTALGAGRLRLVRQLLTESMLLALAGGALGVLLAKWGVALLIAINPNNIPRSREIGIDATVLAFTLGVSILTGVIFGLVPALHASKPDLNETLKEASRGSTTGPRHLLRSTLVVAEVAMALMVLIMAGLVMRSFYHLQQVKPGFNPASMLTFQVSLPQAKYPDEQQRVIFFNEVLDRIGSLPGVQAVGGATGLPLGNNGNQTSFTIEGQPPPEAGHTPLMEVVNATPEYFKTMGIPLLQGRTFTEQDGKDAPLVIVIDESFAKQYWPDGDALGKRVNFGGGGANNPMLTVVGIVGRVKMEGLNAESNRVQGYRPYKQAAWGGLTVVARTATDPSSLATTACEQVLAVDPDQPIFNIRTMEQIWDDSVARERLTTLLFSIFAGVALILAAVGIYGVMAYSVNQRTHEIGIRMALGARPRDVLRLVVGHSLALTIIGVVIGLVAAIILTRLMTGLLFGISATDPVTLAVISLLLVGVAATASFIPAMRAMKVDPMVALRYE
jgi:putative ABC transport system permease protein